MESNGVSVDHDPEWPAGPLRKQHAVQAIPGTEGGFATDAAFLDELGTWVEVRTSNELGTTALATSMNGNKPVEIEV